MYSGKQCYYTDMTEVYSNVYSTISIWVNNLYDDHFCKKKLSYISSQEGGELD